MREKLERTTMPAAVEALTLRVEQFVAPAAGQHDFFDDRARREDGARAVLERLVARLGTEACRASCCAKTIDPSGDRHAPVLRPKWVRHFSCREKNRIRRCPSMFPLRPLWLLREPRALRSAPATLSRPERSDRLVGRRGRRARLLRRRDTGGRAFGFFGSASSVLHGIWS